MNQRPIIGIVERVENPGGTGKLVIEEKYRQKIIEHGGNVIGITPPQDIDYTVTRGRDQQELTEEEKDMLISQMKLVNGILLPGGFKINKFDRFIVEYAIENDIPIFGICLGMQTLANYKKDLILEKNDTFIEHFVEEGFAHSVTLDKNSKLYNIIGIEKFDVVSKHNQHVQPNPLFDVVAVSDDNIIEAIEMKDKTFCVGVQWHPDSMNDETSNRLFNSFLSFCKTKM